MAIREVKARRRLVKQYGFAVEKNGSAPKAGVKMPIRLDPAKDLDKAGIKRRSDASTKQLYRLLTKELPTVVNRNDDVVRVMLTLLNTWETRSSDKNKELLSSVVMSLLFDNNMRTTMLMTEETIPLAYPQIARLPDLDEPSSTSAAESAVMQRIIADANREKEIAKAVSKAKTTTASSSNKATTASKGGRSASGYRSNSGRGKFSSRDKGGSGFSKPTFYKGGSSRRGREHEGGRSSSKRGGSASSSKDKKST